MHMPDKRKCKEKIQSSTPQASRKSNVDQGARRRKKNREQSESEAETRENAVKSSAGSSRKQKCVCTSVCAMSRSLKIRQAGSSPTQTQETAPPGDHALNTRSSSLRFPANRSHLSLSREQVQPAPPKSLHSKHPLLYQVGKCGLGLWGRLYWNPTGLLGGS